ncbi:hypothetical protein SAMN05660349_01541 [Macellibacteroides fermentans]|uniref:Uncharacterized protein n=1 Tax=Parabacteroides chartae TaxID=1037355 RepID=A0A1T5BXH0_9BACT|nr:hypothetical protein SAMN05660349_01541 [Parabacteroides chartae]
MSVLKVVNLSEMRTVFTVLTCQKYSRLLWHTVCIFDGETSCLSNSQSKQTECWTI